jgi:RHS repeat-associated protein
MFSSSVSCLFKWFKLARLWALVTGVFFLAVTAVPVSAAVVISVPATDEDGTFTISWSGTSLFATLFQNGISIAGNLQPPGGSWSFTNLPEGIYTFRVDNYCQVDRTAKVCNSATGTVVVGTPSPIVAAIPDISINEDVGTQASVNVTYGGSSPLQYSAVSSNPALITNASLVFSGSGYSKNLSITPVANASGQATITVTVTAGTKSTTRQFLVTVNAVDDAPVISAIANQSLNEGATTNISFSITDVDSAVGTPTVSSSNTSAVSVSLSSPSMLTVKAGLYTSGTQATITISVPGATRTFTVTLNNLDPELWIEPSGTIGEYNLRWNYGTHYVKIFENGVDVTQVLTNSAHAGIVGTVAITKTANGTFNYYLQDCQAGQYQPTCSGTYSPKSITVTFPLPVVNASVSASTINEGGSTTLTWSSTNATNCSATNISGVTGTSGTKTFTAPSVMGANQVVNIVVTCTGNGGSVSKTVPVTVNAVNDKPLLTVTGTVSATAGVPFTIPFTFSDEETDSADLIISVVSADVSKIATGGMAIDRVNSRLSVVTALNAQGNASIALRVKDPQGLYEEKIINVAIMSAASSSASSTSTSILNPVTTDPANDLMADVEYLGALSGMQSVAADGSFNYSIPIRIPTGINGVQPKLQLNYNSNNKNGLVGWGWSLTGLSVISRCNASMIRDGYTSGIQADDNYKYCLDGQRLVEVSSGQYRTENESFLRIQKTGDYWIVTNNTGMQSRYGYTANSKLADDQASSYAWYLDQQQDVSGNQWTVSYTKTSADGIESHYPASINYTQSLLSAAMHSVIFHYEDRTDISVKYVAGVRFKTDKRLTKIELKSASNTIHSYVLSYQQTGQTYHGKNYSDPARTSRLASVKQCFADSLTDCARPVEFDWSLQTEGNYRLAFVDGSAPTTPDSTWLDINGDGVLEPNTTVLPVGATRAIDMNQDGRDDIVWNGSTGIKVFLSDGSAISQTSTPGFDIAKSELSFEAQSKYQLITANPNEAYTKLFPETGTISVQYKLQYVDMNADGYVDLVRAPNCSRARNEGCSYTPSPGDVSVALNNQGVGFLPFESWLDNVSGVVLENHSLHFIDLNGDGSKDLFAPVDYRASITSLPIFIGISNGTGNSTSIGVYGPYNSELLQGMMGDFNGDGITDLATVQRAANGSITSGELGAYSVTLGVGKQINAGASVPGFRAPVATPIGYKHLRACGNEAKLFSQTAEVYDRCNRAIIDFNGDGLDDIVESGFRISRSCLDPLGGSMQEYCKTVDERIIDHEASVYLSLGADVSGNPSFSAPVIYRNWNTFLLMYPNAPQIAGLGSIAQPNKFKFEDFDKDGAYEDDYRLKNNVGSNRIEAVLESARRIDIQYSTLASNTIYEIIPTDEPLEDELGYVKQAKILAKRLGVKKIEITNGAGGTNKTTYKYIGAKTHGAGYGDLGFATVEKLEEVAGKTPIKTISHYYQSATASYKLAGKLKRELVYTSNTSSANVQLLSDTRYQWKIRKYSDDVDAGYKSPHYFAYLYKSSNQSWDLDGTLIADSQTQNQANAVASCTALATTPTIVVTDAGSSGDVDYSADGVLLYSQTATCDQSGSAASVQVKALENLNITSKGDARGLVQKRKQYAWVGNLISDAAKPAFDFRVQSFTYNDLGQLQSQAIEPDATSPTSLKFTTSYLYNGYGSVSKVTESWDDVVNDGLAVNSRVTDITETYDTAGVRKVVVARPLSLTETTEYHPVWGTPTQQTDANGLVTDTVYDAQGRPRTIIYADGTSTQIDYRTCDNCFEYAGNARWYSQTKTTGSAATRIYYDGLNREVGSRTTGLDGTAVYTLQTYDSRGDIHQATAPFAYGDPQKATTTTYDALGRVSSISHPDSTTETRSYSGLTHTITNRLGQTQTRTLNAAGWVMQSSDNAGTPVSFTYWPFGDLKTTTVNNDQATLVSVNYDALGRKTSMTDPNTGTTTYTYNGLGLIATQVDAKNQRTCFGYDALGRQTRRVDNASTTCTGTIQAWTYDTKPKGKGQLASLSGVNTDGSAYTEQYSYTAHGLPQTTTSVFDGATYTLTQHYDSFNRPLGVTYPTGYIAANAYNSYGHLTQVKDSTNTTLWTADSADASGNITQFTLGNGVVTTQTYDANTQRIDTIRAVKGSLVIQDQDYGFDALGNLTTREDRKFGVIQSFCYDGLNRLKAARFNGCSSAANDFTYDALGNLTTKEGIAGTMGYGTSGTNVTGPHAITSANGWSYQYDAIGNLTTATKAGESTRTVAYSPFNTPTSITQGSKFSTLVYGPNQDRIKHSDSNGRVTKYVGGIYEEVTKGGITQKIHYVGDFALYIQTGGATPTNKHEYLHRDHIGSIVAISKSTVASATDVNWQSNGAWGERRYQQWNGPLDNSLIPSSTARGFTDHEHLDSVGLIHMNGRVYDPELGRFMSADPFVQAPYNSQSYNRYSYTFNNPLSFTDPSGYQASGLEPGECDRYGNCRATLPPPIDPNIGLGSDAWYWSNFYEQQNQNWDSIVRNFQISYSPQHMQSGSYATGLAMPIEGNAFAGAGCGVLGICLGDSVEDEADVAAAERVVGKGALKAATVIGMVVGPAKAKAVTSLSQKPVAYSVAYQTKIDKLGVGERASHFTNANKNLSADMKKDPEFARMMEKLGVSIERFDRSPKNWTWHHVIDQPGVLQLVPRSQHQGSGWQPLLHPNQTGGFKMWGSQY